MKKETVQLAKLLRRAQTEAELVKVIEDLFTAAEVDDFLQRWAIVEQLMDGRPQREIKERVGVSISKVTRASHQIQADRGGFQLLFNRRK